jgi:hypothetical protein
MGPAVRVVLCVVGAAHALGCGARTSLWAPHRDYDASDRNDSSDDAGDRDAGPPPSPCLATAPVVLASGGKEIQFVALDDTTVYWTDFALGTVNAVPKSGGASRVLAVGRGNPSGIVARSGSVFWAEFSSDVVMSTPAAGGAVTMLASNQDGAYEMTAVGDVIYWTTLRGCSVARLEKGKVDVLATAKQPFTSIVSSTSLVFWVSFQQKAVDRYDIASSTSAALLSGGSGADLPSALATDGQTLYFGAASPAEITVSAIPVNGGSTNVLYTSACNADAGVKNGCLGDMTTDGVSVYLATPTDVRKVPVGGGPPTVIADGQARPLAIAVDDKCVYWSNLADGTIWAAPK